MSKFAANGQVESGPDDMAARPAPETIDGIVLMDATWARKQRMRRQSTGPAGATARSGRESSAVPNSDRATSRPAASSRVSVSPSPVTPPTPRVVRHEESASSVPAVSGPPTLGDEGSPNSVGGRSVHAFSEAELSRFLVNFVVEQTGYPEEIVEMDADLEADLGIDSIKKAQLFGELREHFDVTPSDDLSLDDFPTLGHVRDYLQSECDPSAAASGSSSVAPPPSASVSASTPSVMGVPPAPAEPSSAAVPAGTVASSVGEGTALDASELESFLVNFVVEQTGYPEEIVEMDADLEADLGIDSIKKAQLFGELREHFDVTPSDDLSLDDFPTLAHVRDYLRAVSGSSTSPRVSSPVEPVSAGSSATATAPAGGRGKAGLDGSELETFLVNFVVEQTGYPEEIVEMDADLEADLGIDSIKKAQLFGELREHFDVTPSDDLSLDDFPTLADVRDYLVASQR